MKYFFDTEFIEDGRTIDLISIGIVSGAGRELYMVSNEYDESKADEWVKTHVLNHIGGRQKRHSRQEIAQAVLDFTWTGIPAVRDVRDVLAERQYYAPEFWAYYADYDWVALCQLYGRMVDLPKGFPKFCRDLKQLACDLGSPNLPTQTGTNHHALEDARWCKEAYVFLQGHFVQCQF